LPSLEREAERLIGALRGGPGAVARLKLPAAYSKPDAEPVEERFCRHMSSLSGLLKSPSPSEPRPGEEALAALWGPTGQARDEEVTRLLAAFLAHFPRQRADPEIEPMMVNDLLDDLEEFPLYAIRAGLKTARREAGQWRPPTSEILGWCRVYSRQYRALKTHLPSPDF
jgi:hypothetical protein